ncbi:MAG: hypothetical protein IJQ50_00840 [Clostridia bacterium]|nr:hypothetical protein [Clostridia bacterium]
MENNHETTYLKEDSDKFMLKLEWVLTYISTISFFALIFTASFVENMPDTTRAILIIVGFIIFSVGIFYAVKIEQIAGYYECQKCHNKYIPTYKSVFFAMHIGRTRYLKCPKCNQKSWNKKVLNK